MKAHELINEIDALKKAYEMGDQVLADAEKYISKKFKKLRREVNKDDESKARSDHQFKYTFNLQDVIAVDIDKDYLIVLLKSTERLFYKFKSIGIQEICFKKLKFDIQNIC